MPPTGRKKPNGVGSGSASKKGDDAAGIVQAPSKSKPLPVTRSFIHDIVAMEWMKVPSSSFKILIVPILLWGLWHLYLPDRPNPFSYLLYISHQLPDSSGSDPRYAKGYGDLAFLAYYIVVFSFIRQFITIHILRPFAYSQGIRKEAKLDRFAEQGYAVIYWGFFGITGVYVMSTLPTWWFKTDPIFLEYPQWRLQPQLKLYYLLQLSYWIQQLAVLVLRLEKPRKDFRELVYHHLVTLWMIGWSYLMNFVYIGNLVFITMDVSDAFFAFAKCLRYLDYHKASAIAFAVFVCVWTYLRHWLNLVILYDLWTGFDKMPEWSRVWNPREGVWMIWWMKWQMTAALGFLQGLNLFWYFLIWRVLIRAVFTSNLDDERSDDEDEVEPEAKAKKARRSE
ncbi:hypothetical protein BOTBODRAFT_188998 [Botryobasidium botryosum FD-172 SS1]|uniref:TLC domain-containing protein n=1 Tax=Botryobasidium botryosum (strain FD-172 SS1) TaxID=930990 RepID=A0A067MDE6_BOTB1|nr:hypothetical protein BOTBODRAFT_188998 [Botryobasidium botryosum FD-172 SS1]